MRSYIYVSVRAVLLHKFFFQKTVTSKEFCLITYRVLYQVWIISDEKTYPLYTGEIS